MKYGPKFDDLCVTLDTSWPAVRDSAHALGNWNKKKQWDPHDCASPTWSSRLDSFCQSFDPRLPLQLLTGSVTTKKTIGYNPKMSLFVDNRDCATNRSVLVAASYLQGEYYDTNLRQEVYWGSQTVSDRVIPIVIDTGAFISITGERSDFVDGITDVGPDERIQGLNHSIKVMGIGKVSWKIRDQLGQVAVIQTTAYFIPETQVRLFSPQIYFIQEQGGELRMDRFGVHLVTADGGTTLSFPINPGNNLPLALPIPMDSGFCTFKLSEESIFLNAMNETDQNLTAPQKELLGWHQKFGHCGFSWDQSLMIPQNPQYQIHINQEGLLWKVVATKHQSTRTCDHPMCCACSLA
jgi:hypothetical protein